MIKKNNKVQKNRAKDFEGQVNFITKELKTKKTVVRKFLMKYLTMQLIVKLFNITNRNNMYSKTILTVACQRGSEELK